MLPEFFLRALAAGMSMALVAGPLGCFVVWRRMAYFGETMAHASLLGVSLALLTGINLSLTIFASALVIALILLALERVGSLPTDALLGILSHSALALGLVTAAFIPNLRVDLMSFLFGDILAVSWADVALMAAGGAGVLGLLVYFWRHLLAATVSPDIAAAEGLRPHHARLLMVVMVAAVVAVAIKIVGILLIVAMLVIPAATARNISATPERMAVRSSMVGVAAVLLGLFASLRFDSPPGPAVVVAALLLFILSLTMAMARRREGGSV